MIQFDHEYMERLNAAWEHFIAYKDFDYSFMRPEILESWKRSRDFQVNPYERKTEILNSEDIHARLAANSLLIETVRPYMERLYSIVEGSGFYLMLSDQDGYVLDLVGDRDIIEQGKESLLVIGANRKESFAGTNAIGTCLAMKKPIQIWNGEHYVMSHKRYACSGAPIFNHLGQLIGCLNLTGEFTKIHTHTLGMVLSAVDGISKELKIRNAYEEIEAMSAQRSSILESVSSGLILLNEKNQIIQMNGNAQRMLKLENKNAMGRDIFELISIDEPIHNHFSFSNFDRDVYNKETNIYYVGSMLPPVKFNMSVNFIGRNGSHNKGIVIRLDEPKHINKLVNKIGGFKASYTFDNIIGSSLITKKMIKTCERAALSSSNVLILGESGTGKELVAQAVHNGSTFSKGPFVAINCGALPKGLIESELFGYERGSFTGANKEGNPGKFELADGGTIFLDEIGDMPLDVQVSLLRVLQTKEIVRIGAKYPKKINVRIIAATNRDLSEAIEAKTFREDLFYRLNVLTIHVPPLRDRSNDISELADYFVQTLTQQKNKNIHIAAEVYQVLRQYSWPGNIRELENAIERAINVTDDDEIRLEHLPRHICQGFVPPSVPTPYHVIEEEIPASGLNLKSSGYQLILSSLEKSNGNIKEAAELLGISRRTLYRKMDKYKIDYKNYRG
ncbi:sigma-54-dependent Fis family transcriptional regulator [Sinanaerobacter chloroacetimidivorans]|uniref:Sigma 54-interacting transcriptional regulator n=1 Tax=Sinanaerobacter chloroacetimidivorans TaxID=2818044 RepID=A0A8J7W2L3_9FIRM|nr:sigma 54-interacting transcriptional regulator [Sinanaerobacter chloroacetimidivorans]MBR0599226.1 sigma 54-interacting transcriptional regulator [Sinanaerobacter chloroacetimidivorans]